MQLPSGQGFYLKKIYMGSKHLQWHNFPSPCFHMFAFRVNSLSPKCELNNWMPSGMRRLTQVLFLPGPKNYPKVDTFQYLKSNSQLPKKLKLSASLKALKKWWKMLLFHLKSSIRSQDIYVLVVNFWSCRKDHDVITWLTNNCNTHIN